VAVEFREEGVFRRDVVGEVAVEGFVHGGVSGR
jgi:hypothetical protein